MLRMDPERYREVAEAVLRERPEDTWGAAWAVWKAASLERGAWLREHGINRWAPEHRQVYVSSAAPVRWVMDTFGTPEPERWFG
ncbi:hypothetical protein ADL21_06295 [Streptomyces albus subsp. albus]|nr:hypothetical protein ADL21_06295 [Streptomyces albus subsp. albus]